MDCGQKWTLVESGHGRTWTLVLLSINFLFLRKIFFKSALMCHPPGLKIIIRLTLGFYVAGPLGRQAYIRQSAYITSTAAKRQKPGGRHLEAQGKPGRWRRHKVLCACAMHAARELQAMFVTSFQRGLSPVLSICFRKRRRYI